MNRVLFSFAFLSLILSTMHAQPPKPPEGKRWMLNEQFSDEFNGTELDLEKWYDYHPGWKGRQPGIFLPSQVSVADGYLQLKNRKLDKDTVVTFWDGSTGTYSIAGGAVVSRTQGAHYGYYECSQKASKIRMSSTFWMTSGGFPGPEPCNDKYSQELDIQEAVGGATATGNLSFRDHMHSNSHFKYTNCSGVKTNYSRGTNIQLEEGEVSDTFHVYAAHWKNGNGADLYLDGSYGSSISFRTDILDAPFSNPMQINMVTETYDWVVPPTAEDLADDSRNTTYIDYVRSWKLVDIDYEENPNPELIANGGFETGNLSGWIHWGGPVEVVSDVVHSGSHAVHVKGPGAPEQVVNLRRGFTYTLSCYGRVAPGSGAIHFGIKDTDNNYLGSIEVTETEWTKKSFSFTTVASAAGLKLYFYAPDAGTEGWGDDFQLTLENLEEEETEEIPLFDENLRFDEQAATLPTNLPIAIPVLYQANGDREIHLQLRDADSILLEEKTFVAYAGYGLKRLQMPVEPRPAAGNYILVADLRHADSTAADPKLTIVHYLALQDPVDVSVKAMDIRDDRPLEGVTVRIRDRQVQTDAQGMAVFEELAAGAYGVSLENEGYETLQVGGLEAFKDTLLELQMQPLSYRIRIQVMDEITGAEVSGALVSLGENSTESKLDGSATLFSYAKEIPLEVSASRYHDYDTILNISEDETYTARMIRSLADLKFIVKQDDAYLKDALVRIGEQSGTTSILGIVNFRDLETGTPYDYSIRHEGNVLHEDRMELRTDSTVRINIRTIGMERGHEAETIRIWPNPAGDRLFVAGTEAGQRCTILSISGQTLMVLRLDEGSVLDLSNLEPGFYLLRPEGQRPLPFSKE